MPEVPNPTLDAILRKRRRQTIGRAVGAAAAIALCGAVYWLQRGSGPEAPTLPIETPTRPVAPAEAPPTDSDPMPPEAPPVLEAEVEARPIPPLRESDGFVRESVARLSSRPEWIAWIATDELIRRVVASVDAVVQGESPIDQVPRRMRPVGRFEVVAAGAGEVASAASFARYDALTAVLTSLDTAGIVRARRELAPLLDEAYHDLGHPDRTFDTALREAIASLLAAPDVVGEPPLERTTLGYVHLDPELEGLSAAKKQLLRFGPENVRRLQAKLREVAIALGIPAAELPPTPRYAVSAEP